MARTVFVLKFGADAEDLFDLSHGPSCAINSSRVLRLFWNDTHMSAGCAQAKSMKALTFGVRYRLDAKTA